MYTKQHNFLLRTFPDFGPDLCSPVIIVANDFDKQCEEKPRAPTTMILRLYE